MKTLALGFLGLSALGIAVGCGTSKCTVDCAPGYTPDPSACTCLPVDGGAGGTVGGGGQGGASGGGGASGTAGGVGGA